MTTRHPSSPEIIKCRTTADFLAALPLLVGFTATNSIFIVLFSGRFAGRTIRLDLPPDDRPASTAPLLDFICETLNRMREDEPLSPAIVITTDLPFPPGGPAPWHRFARRIERRLRRDGFPPRELCCLAADGWVGFLDPEAPAGGRPLAEIEQSQIARQHRADRRKVQDLSRIGEIPAADPKRAASVRTALARTPEFETPKAAVGAAFGTAVVRRPGQHVASGAGPDGPPEWMREVASVGEKLLGARGRPRGADTARLIRTTAHSDRWLVLVVGLLTRPAFPLELEMDEAIPGSFAGIPVDIDDGTRTPPVTGWSSRRILLSICPDFTDHERLQPILDSLLSVIADTPRELRPGVLALSSLLWWLNGSQTVAHRHLQEALTIDSQHALCLMIERIVCIPLYSALIRWSSHAA